jgi:hypothetical protein
MPIYPVYKRYVRKLEAAKAAGINRVPPEERLVFAMIGAPCLPISLFWMGWTSRQGVSYWSPLLATVLFGFGKICVFVTCYQYMIDCYEMYAASALVGMTVTRYVVAGECASNLSQWTALTPFRTHGNCSRADVPASWC